MKPHWVTGALCATLLAGCAQTSVVSRDAMSEHAAANMLLTYFEEGCLETNASPSATERYFITRGLTRGVEGPAGTTLSTTNGAVNATFGRFVQPSADGRMCAVSVPGITQKELLEVQQLAIRDRWPEEGKMIASVGPSGTVALARLDASGQSEVIESALVVDPRYGVTFGSLAYFRGKHAVTTPLKATKAAQ